MGRGSPQPSSDRGYRVSRGEDCDGWDWPSTGPPGPPLSEGGSEGGSEGVREGEMEERGRERWRERGREGERERQRE